MDRIRLISTATMTLLSILLISIPNISLAEGSTSDASSFEEKVAEEEAEAAATKNAKDNLPLDQLRNFSDIFARIKSDYVEDVSDKELLRMQYAACFQVLIHIQIILTRKNIKN